MILKLLKIHFSFATSGLVLQSETERLEDDQVLSRHTLDQARQGGVGILIHIYYYTSTA